MTHTPTFHKELVTVDLDNHSYSIFIGKNILEHTAAYIRPLTPLPYVIIIADEAVVNTHVKTVCHSLENADIDYRLHLVPSGESSKSIEQFEKLSTAILEQGIERKSLVLAIGGGVIGDLAGFVSASLLRGIPFVQIPTTLLSQVDSSVGGKTGINTPVGKNLVGAFYQPAMVLTDCTCLQTLPRRHQLSGYAEIMKYGFIWDEDFFQWLDSHTPALLGQETDALVYAIKQSCMIKADIVAQDEKEASVRALLNLGHTFGHALEGATGYNDSLHHGEAVSIGIALAYETACALELCSVDTYKKVLSHIRAMRLPAFIKDIKNAPSFSFTTKDLMARMSKDKKVSEGCLHFVLPTKIGTATVTKDVPSALIERILDTHIKNIT